MPLSVFVRVLRPFLVSVIGSLALLGLVESLSAGPVVPGFERLLKDPAKKPTFDDEEDDTPKPDPKTAQRESGYVLLGELNCLSCHEPSKELKSVLFLKQAPVLDGIGSRVTVDFLRKFLADPHGVKSGTTMPEIYHGSEAERAKATEPLVHYLAATGALRHTAPDTGAATRGAETFHKVGCVACHGSRREGAKPFATAVPLGELTLKYSIASLTDFLRDPLKTRPSGRMPHLNLEDKDARDLANYLLRGIKVEPNTKYAYYEGNFPTVPDFTSMKPKATGTASGFDLGVSPRPGEYGLRFEGFLQIAKEGDYQFHLGSDDGSRLTIDGKQVALNDGVHPYSVVSGRTKLSAGAHPIAVDFTQAGGGAELTVEIEGSGLSRQPVAGSITLTKEPAQPAKNDPTFSFDPELAKQGKRQFVSAGCVKCHQLKDDRKDGDSILEAPAIAKLDLAKGCLAETIPGNVPDYKLTAPQREAIRAALSAPAPKPLEPKESIARTMAAFNCLACHEREKFGGPAVAIDELFQGTIKEMGDEGRIPPHLTGIGDKLQTGYLNNVLNNGAKDRPYMLTRMPRFGGNNVGHLTAAFEKADQRTESTEELPDEPIQRVKLTGRLLVGEKGLACVKCHNFNPHKATGIQAVDLTTMTSRLREDWFLRYMINPQKYRPGTRMPSAFPNGVSIQPTIYGGKPNVQLSTVWQYLTDGTRAAVPAGIIPDPIELIPEKDPIVYRNFIQGLSPRGIAVGFPEKVHYAWDADGFSLGLIWQNQFIDASKHWVGRGPGFQTPLGDNIVALPKGAPFAALPSGSAAWPGSSPKEQGYHFRGYRLDDNRRPVFRYDITQAGGAVVSVEDAIRPVAAKPYPSLARTISLSTEKAGDKPIEPMWHRVMTAERIEPQDDGSFLVDKLLKLTVKAAGGVPSIRKVENLSELIVPLTFEGGKAVVTTRYEW
ncbi:MAG: c-type cytochrome [Planctomycetaceae bacterium]|nr:c-type cytochrome [Planctomycetaceae bacterium]